MHHGKGEYHIPFSGHCDLDLVFRLSVSGAYLILFEVGISNLVCGCIWDDEVSRAIVGSL